MDDYAEEKLACPDCGADMKLFRGTIGLFYGCIRYPECDGRHMAHEHNGLPMGIPANRETREWRVNAHIAFDAYWKKKGIPRKRAYKQLAEAMNLSKDETHIALFNIEQCKKVIKLCIEGF